MRVIIKMGIFRNKNKIQFWIFFIKKHKNNKILKVANNKKQMTNPIQKKPNRNGNLDKNFYYNIYKK